MGTYEELKAAIQQVIRTNGNNEITGALLQNALLSIVNVVGANATFAGIATPNTNPGTADQNVFYLATEAGTYVNFGGIEINMGEAVILSNKTGNWVKTTSGFATQQQLTELESVSGVLANTKFVSPSGNSANKDVPFRVKNGDEVVFEITEYDSANANLRLILIISPSDLSSYQQIEITKVGSYRIVADGDYGYLRFYKTNDSGYISTSVNCNVIRTSSDVSNQLLKIDKNAVYADGISVDYNSPYNKDIPVRVNKGEEVVFNVTNYSANNASAKLFLMISPSDLTEYAEVEVGGNGTYHLYANRDYHNIRFYTKDDIGGGQLSMSVLWYINRHNYEIERNLSELESRIENNSKVIFGERIEYNRAANSSSDYDAPFAIKKGDEIRFDVTEYESNNANLRLILIISPSDISSYQQIDVFGRGNYRMIANQDYGYVRFYKTSHEGVLNTSTNVYIVNDEQYTDKFNVYEMKSTRNDGLRVKLLGDSITQGSGSTGYVEYTKVIDGKTYYIRGNGPDYSDKGSDYIVGDYLGQDGEVIWYEATSGNGWGNLIQRNLAKYNIVVKNYGCGGITSSGILERLNNLLQEEDDVVVLMVGTNDTFYDTNVNYEKNLKKLIAEIKSKGKALMVVSPPPSPASKEQNLSWKKYDVCNIARYVCNITNTPFFSFYDVIANYVLTSGDTLESLLPDGIHPNDKLYRLMYYWMSERIGASASL